VPQPNLPKIIFVAARRAKPKEDVGFRASTQPTKNRDGMVYLIA